MEFPLPPSGYIPLNINTFSAATFSEAQGGVNAGAGRGRVHCLLIGVLLLLHLITCPSLQRFEQLDERGVLVARKYKEIKRLVRSMVRVVARAMIMSIDY